MFLLYKMVKCTSDKPLYNPVTKRCIQNTSANRARIEAQKQVSSTKSIKRTSKKASKRVYSTASKKSSKRVSSKSVKKSSKSKSKPRINNWWKDFSATVPKVTIKPESLKSVANRDCVSRSKLPLREHQLRVVEHLTRHRGIIAAFDVGTGKTLTAVVVSQCLVQSGEVERVIVVTPTSLVENFKKEIRKYGANPESGIYEFLTIVSFAKKYGTDPVACKKTLLIIDEAHEFRTRITSDSPDTMRALAAVSCAKFVTKVLLLTATPVYNKPRDILNLIAMVKGTSPLPDLPKDQLELRRLFKNTITFFKKPEDTDDYPRSKVHYKHIVMTDGYYKRYRDVENNLDDMWKNPKIFLSGLRRATNSLEPRQKAKWVINRLLKYKRKTVIYSAFLDSGVKMLQNDLNEHGIKYVQVTGSMTARQRTKAVDDYNSGRIKTMFITKAGGQGLDLKGTRDIILFESSWNYSQEDQVIGRAIRSGSHSHLPIEKRHVDVWHLMLVKPKNRDLKEDPLGSGDEILQLIINKKREENPVIIDLLQDMAIENIVSK